MSRVVARCPYGYPAVVEDLPYDPAGRPFPTLFYLTCPSYVTAVSSVESAGGVRRWARRLAAEPALRRSFVVAAAATRRRRRDLARRHDMKALDGGRSLALGVGGVGDGRRVKCLHAHVAHGLAQPSYVFGRALAAAVAAEGNPWCGDRRCAAFVPEGDGETAP